MKQFLLAFCALALVSSISLLAFNSKEGPAKRKDGITEMHIPSDSILKRGKQLVEKMNYSHDDLDAIALYLDSKK